MRPRAFRRHQAQAHMMRRVREKLAQCNYRRLLDADWLCEPRSMALFKEQPKRCAKPCCGSQRKWHGPRWQEQRQIVAAAAEIAFYVRSPQG